MIVKMYRVQGMNCGGCVAAVKSAIKDMADVIEAQVQLKEPEAIISMEREIPQEALQQALSAAGSYSIMEIPEVPEKGHGHQKEKKTSHKVGGLFSTKKECCK